MTAPKPAGAGFPAAMLSSLPAMDSFPPQGIGASTHSVQFDMAATMSQPRKKKEKVKVAVKGTGKRESASMPEEARQVLVAELAAESPEAKMALTENVKNHDKATNGTSKSAEAQAQLASNLIALPMPSALVPKKKKEKNKTSTKDVSQDFVASSLGTSPAASSSAPAVPHEGHSASSASAAAQPSSEAEAHTKTLEERQDNVDRRLDERLSAATVTNKIGEIVSAAVAESPTPAAAEEADLELEERSECGVEDSARYKGQWRGEKRHGYGKLQKLDGRTYEGNFIDDRAHGDGKFYSTNGVFDGQWVSDQAHGHGRYEHVDGSKYVGEWEHDKKCGDGVEAWVDGSQYKGQFMSGFKHGAGLYTSASGTSYHGQFAQDKMDGHGTYKFPDGRAHIGQFRDGHMNGSGTMEWPNGCKYSGSYKNDMKHGEGTFKWVDGRAYHGQWQCGKQHGNGVLVRRDGQEVHAVWAEGKMTSTQAAEIAEQIQSARSSIKPTPSTKGDKSSPGIAAKTNSRDDDEGESRRQPQSNKTDRASADLALLSGRKTSIVPAKAESSARATSDMQLLRGSACGAYKGPPAVTRSENTVAAPCFTPEGSESEDESASENGSPKAAQSPAHISQPSAKAGTGGSSSSSVAGSEDQSGTGAAAGSRSLSMAQKIQGSIKAGSPSRAGFSNESGLATDLKAGEVIEKIVFQPGRLNMTFADGGVIRDVAPGSIAWGSGVRAGWVILNVSGWPVDGGDKDAVEQAFIDAKEGGGAYAVTFRHRKEANTSSASASAVPAKASPAKANALSLADLMGESVAHLEKNLDGQDVAETAVTPKGRSGAAGAAKAAQVATPEVALGELELQITGDSSDTDKLQDDDPSARAAASASKLTTDATRGTEHGSAAATHRDRSQALITGREVQQWVYNLTIEPEVLDMVRDEALPQPRGCFSRGAARSSLDIRGLDKALVHDKDFVLYLSRAEVDPADKTQWRMLQTLHASLTQSKVACPETGEHWQALGFESADPRIDFNAAGGLLNLVHLTLFLSKHLDLLRAIYWASIGNFPLATVSMRITQMVVEAFMGGKLSTICKVHGVFDLTCQLHAAGLYRFFDRIKDGTMNVVQTYRDVRIVLEKNPARLLKDFETALLGTAAHSHVPRAPGPPAHVPTRSQLAREAGAPSAAAQQRSPSGSFNGSSSVRR